MWNFVGAFTKKETNKIGIFYHFVLAYGLASPFLEVTDPNIFGLVERYKMNFGRA